VAVAASVGVAASSVAVGGRVVSVAGTAVTVGASVGTAIVSLLTAVAVGEALPPTSQADKSVAEPRAKAANRVANRFLIVRMENPPIPSTMINGFTLQELRRIKRKGTASAVPM
jgi:hypothetical protein